MQALGPEGATVYYIFGNESGPFSAEFVMFVPPAPGSRPPPAKRRGTTLVLYDDLGRGTTDDVSQLMAVGFGSCVPSCPRPCLYLTYSLL